MVPVDILENVAFAVLDRELEGQGRVVTLQDSSVIIQHSKLTARVAQERVGPSRVVHIVDCGSDQGGHLVQLIEASLHSLLAEEEGCGVQDVSGMGGVVVSIGRVVVGFNHLEPGPKSSFRTV